MVKKTVLTERVIQTVKSFSEDLDKANIAYDKLIIFGSHAKGNAKPWSDIDVCVVSDRFSDDMHQELVNLLKARRLNSLDVEPHPMKSQDLENPWNPLSQEIKKYGINFD